MATRFANTVRSYGVHTRYPVFAKLVRDRGWRSQPAVPRRCRRASFRLLLLGLFPRGIMIRMGVLSFLSLGSGRGQPGFAHSEDAHFSNSVNSGFADSADFLSRPSRRESDAQRLRRSGSARQKWLIALLLVTCYLLATAVFALMGVVAWKSIALLYAAAIFALTVFVLVVRWGWQANRSEQRLKLPIALVSFVFMLALVYLEPATQILLGPFAFVTLAYGMYRVPRNASLFLVAVLLLAYAGVIAAHYAQQQNSALLRLEILHFASLALSLPGFVYLTGKASLLHRILNKAGHRIRTIEADAERDVLLGCYNRRFIVQALEEQKLLADELNIPLCIAILDLDHFKRINDEMGHLGGDEVLRAFARVAQQTVREDDIFGRYGGEEFLLVFPGTSLLPALNTCERLRAQVEAHPWPAPMRGRVTVSIGVTEYVRGESVLEFFSRADTATYLAKEGGRNQVVVEEPVRISKAPVDEPPISVPFDVDEEEAQMLVDEAGLIDARRSQA